MTWNIKQIHNVSRPDETPAVGDLVEIECVGGFVCEVDPQTRRATETHQRFSLGNNGELVIVRRESGR